MNYNMSINHPMARTQEFAQMVAKLDELWKSQQAEMESLGAGSKQDFKHHNDLPLARIKRIMKSDEDVRMISAEAPILFAKACELFILELTVRAFAFSEFHKRNGLEKEDILHVLEATDIFDFLAEVIINHPKAAGAGGAPTGSAGPGVAAPAPSSAASNGAGASAGGVKHEHVE